MKRFAAVVVCLAGILFPTLAHAQGIMVPRDRRPIIGAFAMKSITVDAVVRDNVAQVQVTQVVRNTGSAMMEVTYLFPIPADGVIDQFTLMVDGKEFPARMHTREEARRIYEEIVRSRRDPALLEYMGYGMLQTSVFPVPAGAERQLVLKYTQVCRRDRDVNEFSFPLSTAKLSSAPIGEIKLNVRIADKTAIKSVYSPSHAPDVKRPDDHSATVTLTQQNVAAADDLRLFWTNSEKPIGATLLSYKPDANEDGYFLLLASPEVKRTEARPASKTVVFVLDRSGSMNGKKIEQAKNALKFVLNNLREGDNFNIVAFDDKIETFKPELQRYDIATRDEAIRFADNIFAGGSTNIDGALKRAFEVVGDSAGRPAYVIFMTDGLPTVGEKTEARIAEHAKEWNKAKAKLFAFGVGFDVNARMLDRLVTENFGSSDYVRPTEDIEATVSKFYSKLTAPVLSDMKVEIAGTDVNRSYPKVIPDMFAGGQVLWAGRYRRAGDVTIKLGGKVGDEARAFEFGGRLADKGDDTYAFVEKLWAVRRVGELINELDLKGHNAELVTELVQLSTKHGILTPYTSFLADERTDLRALGANAGRAREEVAKELDAVSGASGVNLRKAKGEAQYAATAPHGGAQGYAGADGKWNRVESCQVVNNQALWRRNGRWVDASVKPEEEKAAEVVEQFSDKFFELARDNAQLRPFLAMPDGCVVKVNGKVFQVNAQPAEQKKQG